MQGLYTGFATQQLEITFFEYAVLDFIKDFKYNGVHKTLSCLQSNADSWAGIYLLGQNCLHSSLFSAALPKVETRMSQNKLCPKCVRSNRSSEIKEEFSKVTCRFHAIKKIWLCPQADIVTAVKHRLLDNLHKLYRKWLNVDAEIILKLVLFRHICSWSHYLSHNHFISDLCLEEAIINVLICLCRLSHWDAFINIKFG